ncbi:hypothetical protein [Georgenia thermotolerans]|uniref:Uncharacterized protein n=1 Tax=Georgenia thermotolerans TaxID=527326 RepID=A0A7J5UMQ9_9MICO|nr:hypothetical protein [Georgenia thermotolerans]KAE8763668.1 hypothetical protein GB883_12925 [Georgenia thermotolerans]
MSQAQPFQPNLHPDREGVPAADLGPGAPDAAPGFGIGGEDPDVIEEAERGKPADDAPADDAERDGDQDDIPAS